MTHLMVQFLAFDLGDRRFGLNADVVMEVFRAVAISGLPKAPPIVEGVINVRGKIVPVLDIRHRFGLPAVALHPDQHLILARAGARLVALRVDRVAELVGVDPHDVDTSGVAPGAEYVAGIARLADGLLVIHNLDAFLSLEEGRDTDTALTGSGGKAVSPRGGGSST